jgi:acetylornithine deacetylase/succinyl-diaminopimelate desuccinylase-like protein
MVASHAISYARAHHKTSLSDLRTFIQFPSVSAQPKHARDVGRCAQWLASHLRSIGLKNAGVIATARHPIVYASAMRTPERATLLIYGHYDVQPADPLREWRSPPFSPTVRGDDLYGRGACDDKGQLFTHIKALEAFFRAEGAPPVNVKCLIEGEEEIGSPNLPAFIWRNKSALAADAVVMSDTQMLGKNKPALCYAERGALYLELVVHGPKHDLHSGNFGGAIHNPIQALAEITAKLHGADGRIAIPGFYDRVREWGAEERARMARNAPSDEHILKNAKAQLGWGESGYSLHERVTLRPALTINGMTGGYQSEGTKGVIPSCARAKLSFRLVPDQDPSEINELFRLYISRITPPTVRCVVRTFSDAEPVVINPRHPAMRAAAIAYEKVFDIPPAFTRSGGTIPILSTFRKALHAPTVLMGFGLADDRIHAPNEKFHLPNFYKGIETSIWFMRKLAGMKKRDLEPRGAHKTGAVKEAAA